ncbi:MAG TPA: ATP-dependent protease, partial [Deltaproteobacteria bacterium]|nr:ATP-dependent protease [Deltaproteobacteria bacterium]
MAKPFSEVPVDQLRARIDTDKLPFNTTKELSPPEEGVIGQERAIEAIKFGMGMKDLGYNIYVAGPPQTGLTYIAKTFLERVAKTEPTPPDWCYVYNFKEPDKPKSLKLSAGKGKVLKKDMAELVRSLQNRIPEVFDSDDYH